ncbi:unnamed protein product [Polarella glacialis]|uniref:TIR domain-containing protein n=1 Tax=Polarella glacialis TaxID=89957 RepID=A0A813HF86_POLGL|nr:unnamed protein product [Polarella glacialis]
MSRKPWLQPRCMSRRQKIAAKRDVEEAKDAAREEVEAAMVAMKRDVQAAMVAAKKDVEEAKITAQIDVEAAKVAARAEVETAMVLTKREVKEAMAVAKHDVEEAMLAAKKDVEEAKATARDEVEAAMASTKRDVQEAMFAAKMDSFEAKIAAKREVVEAKLAAREEIAAAMAATKRDAIAARAAAKTEVEEAKAEALAARMLGVEEARLAARQNYAERHAGRKRSLQLHAAVPPGKKYNYFLSHKKTHSKLGRQSESLAMALHDSQSSAGFVGFFDIDDLKTITPQQLAEDVKMSCARIVVLHDETSLSAWCQLEWKAAELAGIPVLCIVDAHNVSRTTVLEQVQQCSSHLMVHQWVSYIDTYRYDATRQITEWLHVHCTAPTLLRAASFTS